MIHAKIYRKYKLSKWFLMLPLFLSVFAFSGYTGKALSLQKKNLQTELVVSNRSRVAKRTVIFTPIHSSALATNTLLKVREQETNYLFAFNCLEKVNFRSLTLQIYSLDPDIHLFHLRTNPESPDEDIISSVSIG